MEYAQGPSYSYTKNPELITMLVKGALFVTLAAVIIALIASALLAVTSYQVPIERTRLLSEARAVDLMRYVTLGLYFITSIIFLRWVFVVDSNCHGFGATGMTISPGWAAGWYFIPIACLYKPFQAMSEIRRASTNPEGWLALKAGALLAIWWAVWIISGVIGRIASFAFHDIHSISEFRAAVDWQVADRSIEVVAFVIAITLVYDITRRQRNLVTHGYRMTGDPLKT
jgi:hypothetical protein